ncbi:hypothetical protein [Rhizobium rhizogenes]|uniref:hypothetical protein n=1 Tax=Rhizobium rhizogenes TaxID=359 RepID=UPI002271D63D|nr:hypothetical protein [Rhizobium rhizogenes]
MTEATPEIIRPDKVISLSTPNNERAYADFPNGGRMQVAWAGSDRSKPDGLVYVLYGQRELHQSMEALVPPGSYGVELELRIQPHRPNEPDRKSWSANVNIFLNP